HHGYRPQAYVLATGLQECPSTHHRHQQIEHDHIGYGPTHDIQRLSAVFGLVHRVSGVLQIASDRATDRSLVLDHQNATHTIDFGRRLLLNGRGAPSGTDTANARRVTCGTLSIAIFVRHVHAT